MSAPAGWYPQEDGRQRYWDGSVWTEHFADSTTPQVADPGTRADETDTGDHGGRKDIAEARQRMRTRFGAGREL
jgi:hypothetical protein